MAAGHQAAALDDAPDALIPRMRMRRDDCPITTPMKKPSTGAPSAEVDRARLPPELIIQVIESVLPTNRDALIPASHSSTKTLLALTRVSRITYRSASKLLRQRCLYLDSSRRLGDVLLCLPRCVPTVPTSFSLRNLTSLYLAPFGRSLDDLPTAIWVRELFCEVCETLQRLVIHMPFHTLELEDDHLNVRKTLRQGFEQLIRLEDFTCLGEYPTLSLPKQQTDVWRLWPDLKRLTLFGVPMGYHWLWWDIATLPKLEHVVLARSKGVEFTNIKDEYFNKLPREDPLLARRIKVMLLEAAFDAPIVSTDRWDTIDPERRMSVERFDVPVPFYADESPDELVTSWAKRVALDGSIWDLDGIKIG